MHATQSGACPRTPAPWAACSKCDVCRDRGNFGQSRANLVEAGANLAQIGPNLAQVGTSRHKIWNTMGRVRSNFEQAHRPRAPDSTPLRCSANVPGFPEHLNTLSGECASRAVQGPLADFISAASVQLSVNIRRCVTDHGLGLLELTDAIQTAATPTYCAPATPSMAAYGCTFSLCATPARVSTQSRHARPPTRALIRPARRPRVPTRAPPQQRQRIARP